MKILVTGASGYIGCKLALRLAGQGQQVHALVHSATAHAALQHPNIRVFNGDVLRPDGLRTAMDGCAQVYHTAAKTGAWAPNPAVFYEVNVAGTRQVLATARRCGVARMVLTSTCGAIGPALRAPLTETDARTTGYEIDYDRSKKQGEELALQCARDGMDLVVVSPAKVYGPGSSSHALTANAIIQAFLAKGVAFIPFPGTFEVCFAYIDDVVTGHLQAMARGTSGEKYILGGINVSYRDFFGRLRLLAGRKGHIFSLPKPLLTALARAQELNHRLTGAPVRFTPKSVGYLFRNYIFSSDKAVRELGYRITPLDEALTETIHFLRTHAHG